MCMRGTKEECILLERMAKVEAKQWVPIGLKIFEDSRIISPHKGDNNEQ
jgi:hypothetical protein